METRPGYDPNNAAERATCIMAEVEDLDESDPKVIALAKAEQDNSIRRLPKLIQEFRSHPLDKKAVFAPRVGYISPEDYVGAMLIIANGYQQEVTCLYRFKHGDFMGHSVFNIRPGASVEEITFSDANEKVLLPATAERSSATSAPGEVDVSVNGSLRSFVVRALGSVVRYLGSGWESGRPKD